MGSSGSSNLEDSTEEGIEKLELGFRERREPRILQNLVVIGFLSSWSSSAGGLASLTAHLILFVFKFDYAIFLSMVISEEDRKS